MFGSCGLVVGCTVGNAGGVIAVDRSAGVYGAGIGSGAGLDTVGAAAGAGAGAEGAPPAGVVVVGWVAGGFVVLPPPEPPVPPPPVFVVGCAAGCGCTSGGTLEGVGNVASGVGVRSKICGCAASCLNVPLPLDGRPPTNTIGLPVLGLMYTATARSSAAWSATPTTHALSSVERAARAQCRRT